MTCTFEKKNWELTQSSVYKSLQNVSGYTFVVKEETKLTAARKILFSAVPRPSDSDPSVALQILQNVPLVWNDHRCARQHSMSALSLREIACSACALAYSLCCHSHQPSLLQAQPQLLWPYPQPLPWGPAKIYGEFSKFHLR